MRLRLPLMYVLVAAALLGGCSSLRPVAPVADGPDGVRVLVRAQKDDLFKLEVVNYGRAPIVVDRDRVVLFTSRGARAHVDGGVDTVDWVPPGGHHAVNVRFDLGNLRTGERVAISLAGAVTLDGRPLSVPNLEFVAD
ncbi:MAG TPA: hypothetical protein VN947_12680 [Polyangia bacterium]|nr:hypothetical protein [Polyangia bacterium]